MSNISGFQDQITEQKNTLDKAIKHNHKAIHESQSLTFNNKRLLEEMKDKMEQLESRLMAEIR